LIEAKNLTKKFGTITAVDNISFSVKDGEVFGLLGPNGAGKTTTIRMLCCLISKTNGQARVGDYEIGKDSDCLQIRKMIGLVPDNVGLYEQLSAYRNLDFYARLYDCPEEKRKQNISKFLRMLGLWERKDELVAAFSKGMKQKLAIARALIHDPEILVLDEPTTNLDPEAAKTVRDFILELKKEKKTIFLNTHNLDEAQRICDRIAILKTRLLKVGTPEELRESIWGSKTVVQLDKINNVTMAAVKKLGLKKIAVQGSQMIIDITNPEKDNPEIISAIVRAGGRIQSVSQLAPTLEDVYLKIVGKAK